MTCGGLCPGLNDVTAGIVNKLSDYGVPEGKILGIKYGFRWVARHTCACNMSWESSNGRQVRLQVGPLPHISGWPEPYIYVYLHRIFGDFQAKITVCTPYIYGSGQPYTYNINWASSGHQVRLQMVCSRHIPWAPSARLSHT